MTATLPLIVEFTGVHDGGPCDDGPTAICPHCGAEGRYVFFFDCDDGTSRGAMRGCLSLFPVSEVAAEDKRLRERLLDLQKRFGKDAHLNRFEEQIREAIDAFYFGDITKNEALTVIHEQKEAQREWRKAKGGAR